MKIIKFNPSLQIQRSTPLSMKEVTSINTINHINAMLQLMKQQQGVGLAAPQVGWNKRVIVYGVDPNNTIRKNLAPIQDTIMINPIIEYQSINVSSEYEGNLSIDNVVGIVERPMEINIRYISINKEMLQKHVSGFEARIIQHEVDQLDGILFTQKSKKLITTSEYLKIIES